MGLVLLALGHPCPWGLFEEFEVSRTQLPALPGEPVVLGLGVSWGELSKAAQGELQAEVDRLGASLVLISSGELVCLRASNRPLRASRLRQLWPSGLGPWHRAPAANAPTGPGCVSTRRSSATLAVIDEQGIVGWLWRSAEGAGVLERLGQALAHARRELQERQRLASGARSRDALPYSRGELAAGLVSAFTAAFGAGESPEPAGGRDGLSRLPARGSGNGKPAPR